MSPSSMPPPSSARLRIVVLLAFLVAVGRPVDANPTCDPQLQMNAAGIRSPNSRTLLLAILDDVPVSEDSIPASAVADTVLTSSNSTTQIAVEGFISRPGSTPAELGIVFAQVPDYEIFVNETIHVTLPGSLFSLGLACPTVRFSILPSAGLLVVTDMPTGVTEQTVNDGDVLLELEIRYDHFLAPYVLTKTTPSPGIHVYATLHDPPPSRRLQIRIAQNETFNLRFGDEERVSFVFLPQIMQTGIEPLTGNLGFDTEITVRIEGTYPSLIAKYFNADGSQVMLSEDLWDGKGKVALVIAGDQWIQDLSLWQNPGTRPSFTPGTPVQEFAFQQFLVVQGMRPNVTLSRREALLSFPPMPGFTLSNVAVTNLEISNFISLATENTDIEFIRVRALRADANNVEVTWAGPAFETGSLAPTEADVRRSGLRFTIHVKYSIFATPPNVINLKPIITSTSQSRFIALTLDAVLTGRTTLTITYPPQPETYDISADDEFQLSIPAAAMETQSQPGSPSTSFVVSQFNGSSECELLTDSNLDETQIRTVSGPDLFVTINITTGTDEFCYSPEATAALLNSLSFTTNDARATVTLTPVAYEPRAIVLRLEKDPLFEIATNNFFSYVIPKELMCSLEICTANPRPPLTTEQSFLQKAIRTTPGTLNAAFPTITEVDMRSTDYVISLELTGDAFKVDGATSLLFVPQFDVTPVDPNDRGFTASIVDRVQAVVQVSTKNIATLTIPFNASYDCAATETVQVVIDPSITDSGLPPNNLAAPFVITAVQGSVASNIPRNITVTENDMETGRVTFTVTLTNELLNSPEEIAESLRATAEYSSPDTDAERTIATFLSAAAIEVDYRRETATIRFQPAPDYDILELEWFRLRFTAGTVASVFDPADNEFIIQVEPMPGIVNISGNALFAATLEVVNGQVNGSELQYQLLLTRDKWIPTPLPNKEDVFCVLTQPCSVVQETDQRRLTVTFPRNEDYFQSANRTFPITIPGEYLLTNRTPLGTPELFVYITSGLVLWGFSSVVDPITEDVVREGQLPEIQARVQGDKFSVPEDVRSALSGGVTCEPENQTDAYSFCSRAAVLFQTRLFRVDDARRVMTVQLQPDPLFDVYKPETVTLHLGARAFQSQLAPDTVYSFTFTVQPTAGKYFIGGTLDGITQSTINDPALAANVKIDVTLYGERWYSNVSESLVAMHQYLGFSSSRTQGFLRVAERAFDPISSATLDPTGRRMTLTFMPVPDFVVSQAEFVQILVPRQAVRSDVEPELASVASGFDVTKQSGIVVLVPGRVSASQMRTTGVNVTFNIVDAKWNSLALAVADIAAVTTTRSSPKDEPHGFAVFRETLLPPMLSSEEEGDGEGSIRNAAADSFDVALPAVPGYTLERPEAVVFTIPDEWIVSGSVIDPKDVLLQLDPDYPEVELVLDVGSVDGVVDVWTWKSAVAEALGILPTEVELSADSPRLEDRVAQPNQYRRMTVRIRYTGSHDAFDGTGSNIAPQYDNTAAQVLVAIDSTHARTAYNAVVAFYNSTPPSDAVFDALLSGAALDGGGAAVGTDTIWLLSFGGAVLVVFFVLFLIYRFNRGKNRSNLRWDPGAAGERNMESKDEFIQADDEAGLKRAAAALYAGQRVHVPTAAAYNPATNVEAVRDETGVPMTTTVARRDDDEVVMADLPVTLYAGQSSPSPAAAAGSRYLPPSLLDRVERAAGPAFGSSTPGSTDVRSPVADMVLFPDEEAALQLDAKRAQEERLDKQRKGLLFTPTYVPPKHRSKFAVSETTGYRVL